MKIEERLSQLEEDKAGFQEQIRQIDETVKRLEALKEVGFTSQDDVDGLFEDPEHGAP